MLRLTIYSAADKTDAVVAVLRDQPSMSGLAVLRGASLRPQGDVVMADIARESANDVVDLLRATRVHVEGTVHVDTVQTWMSLPAFDAERLAPGSSSDSVVWADVVKRAYDDSELNWSFLSFMSLATILAAVAIVLDSQILVIGAMILGPEFGAVAALGVALVRRRHSLFRLAGRTLLWGFICAIAVTTLAGLAGRALGWVDREDITGPRPETGFIYAPDKWSFLVALIAASAGVLSLTSAKVGGLSGVFVSVTTIPAAGNVALGIAFGSAGEVWGSLLQLVVNVTGMALAGWVTLAFQQYVWARVAIRGSRAARRDRPEATDRRVSKPDR